MLADGLQIEIHDHCKNVVSSTVFSADTQSAASGEPANISVGQRAQN